MNEKIPNKKFEFIKLLKTYNVSYSSAVEMALLKQGIIDENESIDSLIKKIDFAYVNSIDERLFNKKNSDEIRNWFFTEYLEGDEVRLYKFKLHTDYSKNPSETSGIIKYITNIKKEKINEYILNYEKEKEAKLFNNPSKNL